MKPISARRSRRCSSGPGVEFIGEINERGKTEFLGEALALLFPIDWPEPFGLVMIEAMACGTPVLAFRRGSVPEMIDDGVTGLIVDTIDEAVRTLPRVLALDRAQGPPPFRGALHGHPHGEGLSCSSIVRCSKRAPPAEQVPDIAAAAAGAGSRDELTGISWRSRAPRSRNRQERRSRGAVLHSGNGPPATRPRHALKHDDTFVVLDSHGDIGASAGGPDGLFHCDTRFLSHLEFLLNGMQPLLLGSNVRDDNTLLTIDLTNPDIYFEEPSRRCRRTLCTSSARCSCCRDTAYQRFGDPQLTATRPVDPCA